jgi:hypothetical protein
MCLVDVGRRAVAVRPLTPDQSSCLTRNSSMVSVFEVNSSTQGGSLIEKIQSSGQMKCVLLLEARDLVPTSRA